MLAYVLVSVCLESAIFVFVFSALIIVDATTARAAKLKHDREHSLN